MWACGHALAGIAGSNPARDMDICFLLGLCGRADHSSRGVTKSVVCPMSVIAKPVRIGVEAPHKKN
jgi:hypothetical protein